MVSSPVPPWWISSTPAHLPLFLQSLYLCPESQVPSVPKRQVNAEAMRSSYAPMSPSPQSTSTDPTYIPHVWWQPGARFSQTLLKIPAMVVFLLLLVTELLVVFFPFFCCSCSSATALFPPLGTEGAAFFAVLSFCYFT